MRIAIDASRTTVARVTGTERYALDLIRALLALDTPDEWLLYFRDLPPPGLFPPHPRLHLRVISQRRLWTHTRFAAALWRDRPDVTFVPAHTLPLVFPGRAAVTVHDLGFRRFPHAHPLISRLYLEATTPLSAARASVVFADSAATADDLERLFGTPRSKIRVVYPGVTAPPYTPADIARVRARYRLPERYFLFIGTLQPRKNIARLVAAYRRYRQAGGDAGLVLAGGKGWLYDPAWVADAPDVTLTGYIDEADKGALYAGALALVLPSLYEGFGFPVVEAMHCGTPVLCSTTSSLPELAGDAAVLVDPLDVESMAAGMTLLAHQPELRATLRARGAVQAARFTWDAAARAVLDGLRAA